MNNIVS